MLSRSSLVPCGVPSFHSGYSDPCSGGHSAPRPKKTTLHKNENDSFVYVPLCFAYILPVGRYGLLGGAIPPEVRTMSKRPFVVMGLLDCLAGTLLAFAAVYLPGLLLLLLPQAAIPISMLLSGRIKGERYRAHQYIGAIVVVLGILAVLEPLLSRSVDTTAILPLS